MVAAEAHAAKTGDQRRDDHRPADSDIHRTLIAHQLICPVAEQEHQPVQAPEQTGCQTSRIAFVAPDMIATTSSTAPASQYK